MAIRFRLPGKTAALLTVLPLASQAHHALDTLYDRDSSITLTGTVMQIDWLNPHVVLHLAVTEESGRVIEWRVEMDAPRALMERGWTDESIATGATVTVEGFRPLEDQPWTEARSITLENGNSLTASTDTSWNWGPDPL